MEFGDKPQHLLGEKSPARLGRTTRRGFVGTVALAGVGTLLPKVWFDQASGSFGHDLVYFVRPVLGVTYTRSFLRFCGRSRFVSAADAINSVVDRSKPFQVVSSLEKKP